MGYQDKTITCRDCGSVFTFRAEDQEYYEKMGYTNEPKRCPACRYARRGERVSAGGTDMQRGRQMYPAVCAECGRETLVPFEPRGFRPVYCNVCFRKSSFPRTSANTGASINNPRPSRPLYSSD